jgi:hypothetical protein
MLYKKNWERGRPRPQLPNRVPNADNGIKTSLQGVTLSLAPRFIAVAKMATIPENRFNGFSRKNNPALGGTPAVMEGL